MRIVFIVLQLSQPRCIKRISSFVQAGFDVSVYGYSNGFYEENLKSLPFKIDDSFCVDLNKKNKIKRKYRSYLFLRDVIFKENGDDTIFYLMGSHIGIFCSFFNIRYIYEESDIEAIKQKNLLLKGLLLLLDKYVLKKSLINVFTSEGFADYFYGDKRPNNLVIQPNKLSGYFTPFNRENIVKKRIDQNNIRFGFIGIIRYPNTILRFAKVIADKFANHEFHFWGQPACTKFDSLMLNCYPNIFYHGTFKNPEDLASIYRQIDINIACYDIASGNVRVAEPNKLYESIFFSCPIVVSENTFLGKKVKEMSVGYVIDASKDENIIQFVESINDNNIQSLVNNARKIESGELIDNPNKLLSLLKEKIS